MIELAGRTRVDPMRSVENLAMLLTASARRGYRVLMVGPPPIADAGNDHLVRTLQRAEEVSAMCRVRGIPFIPTTRSLADDPAWSQEALAGDGAHPGVEGYRRLTELILHGSWSEWIRSRER
jgi:acyl-CoA thioesterase-1